MIHDDIVGRPHADRVAVPAALLGRAGFARPHPDDAAALAAGSRRRPGFCPGELLRLRRGETKQQASAGERAKKPRAPGGRSFDGLKTRLARGFRHRSHSATISRQSLQRQLRLSISKDWRLKF